jgi:hypothetical protein
MKTGFASIRLAFLILVVSSIVGASVSCRSHRSFQHYSVLFEVRLKGAAKRVPDSDKEVLLVSIDHKLNKGLFRVTDSDSGKATEEWVGFGDFFGSGFGSRGLRVSALRNDAATLQRFSVK